MAAAEWTGQAHGAVGGMWWGTVTVEDGYVVSGTPCCDATVSIPLRDLEVLAEIGLRCPRCGKRWDFKFDPWTPGHDAFWSD